MLAEFVADFPTLWVVPAWVEAHCPVPDGFRKGTPMQLYTWQLWCTVNHYRVRADAVWMPDKPLRGDAFFFRRSQFVGSQKTGKSELGAAIICNEAAGPALFGGWAGADDGYDCQSHGCGCGWEYPYEAGEPMGMQWPTPLIQILGPSEANTDNVFKPLQEMIKSGPLVDIMRVTETGISILTGGGGGTIEPVTSSAKSRIGNLITFGLQEETGWYTKRNKMVDVAETQRRGCDGMAGRTIENTNTWDPADQSLAQKTYDSPAPDIFKYYRKPPAELDYRDREQRRQIHAFNYEGCLHTSLDSINAGADELVVTDPAQAERFFGNRCHVGDSVAFDIEKWKANATGAVPAPRSLIVIGVDGARFDDALAIVATDVATGFQWPLVIITRPEDAGDGYEHDFERADGAMIEAFNRWKVWRVYIDPQRIEKLVERWQGRWKSTKVIEWHTNRPRQVCYAVRNYRAAITSGDCTNDGDELMAEHIANARRRGEQVKDDEGKPMSSIQKEFPGSPLKIDAAMAGLISWECRGDAIAAGVNIRRASGRIWDD